METKPPLHQETGKSRKCCRGETSETPQRMSKNADQCNYIEGNGQKTNEKEKLH